MNEEAFLREIADRPDEDAPRLVLADWFDDNGDPDRAEFIRAQCKLAALSEDDPSGFVFEERAGDVLARNRSR